MEKQRDLIIEKIRNMFSQLPEIEMVILYGSAASGRFTEHSDVDLAVSGMAPITFQKILDLNARLQVLLKRNIDLVDISRIEGLLHYKIFTQGILIKGTPAQLAGERIKALDFHADFLPQLNRMRRKRIEKVINGT